MLKLAFLALTYLTFLSIDILDHFLLYNNFLLHYDFFLYVHWHFHDFFDPLLSRILASRKRFLILVDITSLEAFAISKLEVALLCIRVGLRWFHFCTEFIDGHTDAIL